MNTLMQNIRYGVRMMGKAPGFTAIAVLTLALGIGANTAIFSVVYAALLRSLPYSQPSQLITLSERRYPLLDKSWVASYPDYEDWTKQSKAFQSLAGFSGDGFVFHGGGEPQVLFGAQVTTNFFSTLGVKPMLGRDFVAGEDIASGPKVAILTYKFWRKQFGGDPHVVGRTMQLDANSVSIIGVLPPDFEYAPVGNADVWVPMHLGSDMATRRNLRWMRVVGRLGPRVTFEQARAEMNAINARLAVAYPQQNAAIKIVMIPLRERIVGQIQALLLILFGAVGLVLLIACANVANLLMVRAAGRRREFAIRAALGASRGRLVSQLLTESLMLAAAGGALGFLAAQWGTSLLVRAIPEQLLASMPFLRDTQPNSVILVFLCGVALLTGILFGLAPALQVSHEKVGDALKEETRTSAGGVRTRLRDALVVAEIALSLVLLVGAGLMVKSLGALLHRNPGFDTQNLMTFGVNLPATSYPKDPDAIRFDKEFSYRVASLPGVAGIANTSVVPLSGGGNSIRFIIEGQSVATGHENECDIRDISNNYFTVMKIPVVAGRVFDDSADSATAPKHVIVNQAWVKEYFHGENPIGKRIKFTFSPTQPYREIVGVVGNIADEQLDSPEMPAIFCPFAQDANSYINYMVRAAGNPASVLGAIRSALKGTDSQLFPIQPLTMDEIIAQSPSVFLRRYPSYLIGSFAGLALILAMIGLYGLISYSMSQRTRELGIRIALGAQERDVMRLVMGQGARLAVIGVSVGIVAGLALTQLMRSLLYGVSAADPLTFAGVAILLTAVAILACYIPARRAMRTDPIVALRYE
ncbi:MAG: ABC transporter permease [Candidatus Acidiferrales bacterium]